MNRNFILITILLLLSIVTSSQVTMKLGTLENVQPGTYVNVPLIVSGLSPSGQSFVGTEVYFYFQSSIVTFNSLANGHPLTPVSQWFSGSQSGKVSANWLEPNLNPINVDDNSTLIEFVFYYTGGQTDLTFDEATTAIVDMNGTVIPISQFINGSISQSQGSGSSVWNGTADWSQTPNWSNSIPGDSTNAVINSGVVSVLSGAVCRDLTINQGAKLIIQPGFSLTINGNFTNSGEILIETDSLIQGSLIVGGNVTQTGSSAMKYKVYNGIMYQLAAPVEGAQATLFNGVGTASIFNENTNSWSVLPAASNLESGRGYALDATANFTIPFSGLFKSLVLTKNLSFTSTDFLTEGWNLVGNPYTSSFETDNHLITQKVDRAIYIWDGSVYKVWNGTCGSIPGGIIPPMSAFFVKANASGAQLTFEEEGKIHDFTHYGSSFSAPQNVLPVYLRNFNDLSIEDKAFIQVESNATFYYDGTFDALKLNNAADYPEIYLHSFEDYRMAIAAIPEPTDIEAGIRIPVDGTYVISAETFNFLPERPVYLIDQELNIVKNLRNEDYTFIVSAGDHPNRFRVVLSGLGIDDNEKMDRFIVYADQEKIRINSIAENGMCSVKVFDIYGRLVSESNESMVQGSTSVIRGIRGINIISVETPNSKFQFKVILN
jgi:hypothetical protein